VGSAKPVLILGAGEIASGIAVRLHRAGYRLLLTEIAQPLAVRRRVSFSEAVYDGEATVEGVTAVRSEEEEDVAQVLEDGRIPLLVVEAGTVPAGLTQGSAALVDGRLLKGNHRLSLDHAPLVVGLGPGFLPGVDCHAAIETNRGPSMGAVLVDRPPEANTGVPGTVGGLSAERVLRAPAAGRFESDGIIGDRVGPGDELGRIGSVPLLAPIGGTLRGLIRPGTAVREGLKVGDIDTRPGVDVGRISDKSISVSKGVIEALRRFGVRP